MIKGFNSFFLIFLFSFLFLLQIQNNSALSKMQVYLAFSQKSESKVVEDWSSSSAAQTASFSS